ncbi:hypothetical protein Y047_5987 [Burkholderia pseudomallei MSHR3016]|nr:hypothetical protein Y047_5987 [Burkholderia pseudomallei MSHR3016]
MLTTRRAGLSTCSIYGDSLAQWITNTLCSTRIAEESSSLSGRPSLYSLLYTAPPLAG